MTYVRPYNWRASVASETVLGVDNAKSGICYWRASVASETLTGVTQLKIGDVYLLASERSERDSIRGGQCKIGYMLYICMYVWMVRMPFKRARVELFSPKSTAF